MTTITLIHVVLSLVGIVSGFVVFYGLLAGKWFDRWTVLFLATTVVTNATGFLFPFKKLLPSHVLAILSLIVLAVALFALYGRHLAGAWRVTYIVAATLALYVNVFVLVVQSFLKVPALKALAPTQSEPPFAITQLVVLAAFVVLGIIAAVRFRGESLRGSAVVPLTHAAGR